MYHAMKMYGTVEVQLHAILTSPPDGGEWSASCPAHFILRERASGTHLLGGWVGLRASLNLVVKRKAPAPAGNQTAVNQSTAQSLY